MEEGKHLIQHVWEEVIGVPAFDSYIVNVASASGENNEFGNAQAKTLTSSCLGTALTVATMP